MNSRDNALSVPFPSSEETPSVSMERLSHFTTVPGKEYLLSATSNPCLTGDGAHLRASCQSDRFPYASSQSTNRSKPKFLSDQGHRGIQHVQQEGMLCCNEGCHRQIETGPMFREREIDVFCSDHQSSDVIATRTAHCQFTGCFNIPKYGQRKGPLKFCRYHKRAGMYTNRNGHLLLATRDGSAFKNECETEAVSAATSRNNFAAREEIQYNTAGDKPTDGFGWRRGHLNSREGNCFQPSSNIGLQGFVEPADLGLLRAQDKSTSSAVGVMTIAQMSRPLFRSRHKKEFMVGLKNRPCIFPGCNRRPHYGLLGSRPIYCAKHKEANMVHLLTEATTREKMGVTRDLKETIRTTPKHIRSDSKRLLSAKCSKEGQLRRKLHKKNAPTFQVEDGQELDSRKGANGASLLPLPRLLQPQRHKMKDTGKRKISGRYKVKPSIPTASHSSPSTGTSTSSNKYKALIVSTEVMIPIETGDTGEWDKTSGAFASLPAKKENARWADALDTKTSSEVQALEDIRESAQTDATTRVPERRARVPSRKALEASGKLKNEDIQWLTKGKKEEEVRRTKEFRAQRKAAVVAGLRAGQVIEAATIGPTFGADSANCAGNVSNPEQTKIIWRKLSPAEILQVAAGTFTTEEIETARPRGRGEVAPGDEKTNGDKRKDGGKDAIAGTSEGKRNETVRTLQGTTRVVTLKSGTPCPQDVIHREECHGNLSVQSRQVIPSPDRKETRKFSCWGSIEIAASTAEAGDVNGMRVCQFEDCSKRARFGVNGIVRYCKLHALFGMHRIDVQS